MPMLNFRAGQDLADALRARAGDDDVALSELIRRACQELLDREATENGAPRHLHRFVATGAFRHDQGVRSDERRCVCGEVSWS